VTLRELQQEFVRTLEVNHLDIPFLNGFKRTGSLCPEKGILVYKNNHKLGLTKTLIHTYPVLYRLLGEACFRGVAGLYIHHHHSESPNLEDYGGFFPEFIRHLALIETVPYLADVVELEWAVHRVMIGPDNVEFDWQTLSSVPLEKQGDLILYRSDNSFLIHSPFPIDRIFESNQVGFTGSDIVDLSEGAVFLYIARIGFDCKIRRIDAFSLRLLHCLDGRCALEQLPLRFCAEEDEYVEVTEKILAALPKLIREGCIAGYRLET